MCLSCKISNEIEANSNAGHCALKVLPAPKFQRLRPWETIGMAKVGMKGGKEGERGKKIKFKKKVPKKVKTQENIEQLKSQYGEINSKTVKTFQDLPLSNETLAGLKAGK